MKWIYCIIYGAWICFLSTLDLTTSQMIANCTIGILFTICFATDGKRKEEHHEH